MVIIEFAEAFARKQPDESYFFYCLNPIQTGLFWIFLDRGCTTPHPPSPLCNFQNIQAITVKLRGYVVCQKVYLLAGARYVIWWRHITRQLRHDLQTADFLDPPSWISKIFQNVRKRPKLTNKYWKTIKKRPKKAKKTEVKVLFINRHKKLQIWKNTFVKMPLPWKLKFPTQWPVIPSYLLYFIKIKQQSLAAFDWILKNLQTFQVSGGPRPGLDRVNVFLLWQGNVRKKKKKN